MQKVLEYTSPRELNGGTDSEKFISDSDAEPSSTDKNVDEELALMISMQKASRISKQPAKKSKDSCKRSTSGLAVLSIR